LIQLLHWPTMPDASIPPQPQPHTAKRHSRRWLVVPYALVLAGLIAWSGAWWMTKLRIERTLDDQAAALRARGYQAGWSAMTVDGWPFSLKLTLEQPRIVDPSGWGLSAPAIKGDAGAYDPGHWIFAAPQGLIWTRPEKGPVAVAGRAIRASVSGLGGPQPRLSFEGLDLTLTALPGAQPATFSTIDRLELHLQPGPEDQAALLVKVEKGKLDLGSSLARISPALDLTWDSRLSHLSAFRGPDWTSAVKTWTASGGLMTVAGAKLGLGALELNGAGGTLTVGPDGRLRGQAALAVGKGGGFTLGAIHIGGLNIGGLHFSGAMPLRFEDGQASMGIFPLGRALRVY
jgi:hypothetical protein